SFTRSSKTGSAEANSAGRSRPIGGGEAQEDRTSVTTTARKIPRDASNIGREGRVGRLAATSCSEGGDARVVTADDESRPTTSHGASAAPRKRRYAGLSVSSQCA